MQAIHSVSGVNKLCLRQVARDRVEVVSENMKVMPDEQIGELKNKLRWILGSAGGTLNIQIVLKSELRCNYEMCATWLRMCVICSKFVYEVNQIF